MDIHALAFLAAAESWDWKPVQRIQLSGESGGKFKARPAKLLYSFIEEAQAYPHSQLVEQFWSNVERGHPGLGSNSELALVREPYLTLNHHSSKAQNPLSIRLPGRDNENFI